jgi:hypothetical protein
LRLDAAERRHLFVLADRPPALKREAGPEVVDAPIRRMLASLGGQPAYVIGRRWDILRPCSAIMRASKATPATSCT